MITMSDNIRHMDGKIYCNKCGQETVVKERMDSKTQDIVTAFYKKHKNC